MVLVRVDLGVSRLSEGQDVVAHWTYVEKRRSRRRISLWKAGGEEDGVSRGTGKHDSQCLDSKTDSSTLCLSESAMPHQQSLCSLGPPPNAGLAGRVSGADAASLSLPFLLFLRALLDDAVCEAEDEAAAERNA